MKHSQLNPIETQPVSLIERLTYCFAGAAAFVLFYGGASELNPTPINIDFYFEPRWYFLPQFAPIYLSVLLPLSLLPFLADDRQQIRSLAKVYVIELLTSCAFYILVPLPDIATPPAAPGVWGTLFSLLDLCNMNGNYFPSLHVTFAVTIAQFLGRSGSSSKKIFLAVWAALVAVSTLVLHQHYLIDLLGGALLGQVAYSSVFTKRSNRDESSQSDTI